ncbi:MAG: sortase [Acidimicrobiia bacterium]
MRPQRRYLRFIVFAATIAATLATAPAIAEDPGAGLEPNAARQPSIHRSQGSAAELGTLRIPAIGVDETVRSGVALSVIDQGVAHWSGTAQPGESGNVVLAGHRTTHSRPFFNLDRLEVGDLLYVTDGNGFEVMYSVDESFVVEPTDMWITYESGEPTLTMFACHPKGSARYRIVVTANLVAGRPIA